MPEDQITEEETLTKSDIEYLNGLPQIKTFLKSLSNTIEKYRKEVDFMERDRLNELQGRIRAIKYVINMFEESYE